MHENFLDAVECYAMLRLLLTQEPHIAALSQTELEGGAQSQARERHVLDRAEEDLKVLIGEILSLLPPAPDRREIALGLLDRVLLRLRDGWLKAARRRGGTWTN